VDEVTPLVESALVNGVYEFEIAVQAANESGRTSWRRRYFFTEVR
jgi:hypothetical protein